MLYTMQNKSPRVFTFYGKIITSIKSFTRNCLISVVQVKEIICNFWKAEKVLSGANSKKKLFLREVQISESEQEHRPHGKHEPGSERVRLPKRAVCWTNWNICCQFSCLYCIRILCLMSVADSYLAAWFGDIALWLWWQSPRESDFNE